jgi:hypothetical protein
MICALLIASVYENRHFECEKIKVAAIRKYSILLSLSVADQYGRRQEILRKIQGDFPQITLLEKSPCNKQWSLFIALGKYGIVYASMPIYLYDAAVSSR